MNFYWLCSWLNEINTQKKYSSRLMSNIQSRTVHHSRESKLEYDRQNGPSICFTETWLGLGRPGRVSRWTEWPETQGLVVLQTHLGSFVCQWNRPVNKRTLYRWLPGHPIYLAGRERGQVVTGHAGQRTVTHTHLANESQVTAHTHSRKRENTLR